MAEQALPVRILDESELVHLKINPDGTLPIVITIPEPDPAIDKSNCYFVLVPKNSVATTDIIVPNGETWLISCIFGNAGYESSGSMNVQIRWGTDILYVCYGDFTRPAYNKITGDGSKILQIRLTNNTANDRVMGGGYIATLES